RARFRVLAAGVKLTGDETASEILSQGQAVAGHGHESGAVQWHHSRVTQQANPGGTFGQYRRQCVGSKCNAICVVQEHGGLALNQFSRKALLKLLAVAAHGESGWAYTECEGAD